MTEYKHKNYWWIVLLLIVSQQVFGSDARVFITPSGAASLRVPVGISGKSWEPYTTAGFSCTFPSAFPLLNCFAGLETGTLHQKRGSGAVQILDMAFGVRLLLPEVAHGFSCSPFASLSSVMAGMKNGQIGIKGLHVFSDVENEFGVTVGISPTYHWRRFEVEIPLFYERIFSTPDRFSCIGLSLLAGYRVGGAR